MGTITKVADFYGDFDEAARRFNSDIRKIAEPLDLVSRYYLYDDRDEPYLLALTQSRIRLDPYNIVLTVASDSFIKAESVIKEFQTKSGIELQEAPLKLKTALRFLELPFRLLRDHKENERVFILTRPNNRNPWMN